MRTRRGIISTLTVSLQGPRRVGAGRTSACICAIADDLRGSIDGWDGKPYVRGTMLYRFIFENLTSHINTGEIAACNINFDHAKLTDEEAEQACVDLVKTKDFFICPQSFSPMSAGRQKR